MTRKYFKPLSVTWWISFVTFAAGVFVATVPLHGYHAAAQSIYEATGMTAPVLINAGLFGIGLRGAVK